MTRETHLGHGKKKMIGTIHGLEDSPLGKKVMCSTDIAQWMFQQIKGILTGDGRRGRRMTGIILQKYGLLGKEVRNMEMVPRNVQMEHTRIGHDAKKTSKIWVQTIGSGEKLKILRRTILKLQRTQLKRRC